MIIDRDNIFGKAFHDCMKEMYAKSQPEADYDNLLEEFRSGKIGKDERIYERHYLSMDEFLYIRDKYKDAYNIKTHWKDDVEVVEEYLSKGGLKDSYIPEKIDKDGFKHPGYRSAEKVLPIKEQIRNLLQKYTLSDITSELSEEIANLVLDNVKECKNFYKFDREENSFDYNIALGASPTSNPETVKQWWKDNYNVDIEIKERNPKLFWYYDHEYTDEDLAEEFEDYGENWKEKLDQEWKEEIAEKKRKEQEAIEELNRLSEELHKNENKNEEK